MNRPIINHRSEATRRGSLMPAIAFALLVVGAIAALVMNRLWIDAAKVELRNTAEASALAAASDYLGDHLLHNQIDFEQIVLQAKQRAVKVSLSNTVAGQPIELDAEQEGDIRFGYRNVGFENGESVFLESNSEATSVIVRTQRSRQLGNPIGLFFAGVTSQPVADAQVYAEASFDNLINHFEPTRYLTIPALPIAILAKDVSGKRFDTWEAQITNKLGADRYRFNEETDQVEEGSDGVIEMELHSVPLKTDPLLSNVQLLEFNNDLNEGEVSKQIKNGLNQTDLKQLDKKLPAQRLFSIAGNANITTPVQLSLESQIGQKKLCLLYTSQAPITVPGWSDLICQRVVAIRIMKVIPESNEAATIIVQPTVMATKTAALVKFQTKKQLSAYETSQQPTQLFSPNRYVYKIYIRQ